MLNWYYRLLLLTAQVLTAKSLWAGQDLHPLMALNLQTSLPKQATKQSPQTLPTTPYLQQPVKAAVVQAGNWLPMPLRLKKVMCW